MIHTFSAYNATGEIELNRFHLLRCSVIAYIIVPPSPIN